ncbi:MAG: biotin/lipoyl-binding protein, partial [Actinomycetota bacterium]|nr:biotin/lipoyl-binding protein [Actinomycetota bacterium]
AKVVVWGRDRDEARRRMLRALGETVVEGVITNEAVHLAVLEHPDFMAGRHSTRWLEERLDFSTIVGGPGELPGPPVPAAAAPPGARSVEVEVDGRLFRVRVYEPESRAGPRPAAAIARARRRMAAASPAGAGRVVAPMQGTIVSVDVAVGDSVEAGQAVCVLEAMKMENQVDVEVPGTVTEVRVRPGDTVAAGDVLLVVVPQPD